MTSAPGAGKYLTPEERHKNIPQIISPRSSTTPSRSASPSKASSTSAFHAAQHPSRKSGSPVVADRDDDSGTFRPVYRRATRLHIQASPVQPIIIPAVPLPLIADHLQFFGPREHFDSSIRTYSSRMSASLREPDGRHPPCRLRGPYGFPGYRLRTGSPL